MNKKKILILVLLIFIAGIGFLIFTQSYPVALVNWQSISAGNFNKNFDITVYYYKKAVETYDKNTTSTMDSPEINKEIGRAVLDKLIENILVLNELGKHLKNSEIDQMVKSKVDEILNGKDIEKQVQTIYNLSLDEFKKRFLKPEVRAEILQARLLLENKNFDDWLKDTKKQAKVVILLPGFGWNGEGVVVK